MNNHYMGTVYQNPSIYVKDENDYKSVCTKNDIYFGEIVLIEHVFTNKINVCSTIIEHNKYLFDQYYPRCHQSDNMTEIVQNKRLANNFTYDDNMNTLTDFITKFNHSCTPNCMTIMKSDYKMENTNITFLEIYAVRNIPPDTELTISYGPKSAHERDFECTCGKTLQEREKICNIYDNIGKSLIKKNYELSNNYIYAYLETAISKKILFYHYLSNRGIFMNDDKVSAYDEDGLKLINKVVFSIVGFDIEKLDNQTNTDTVINEKLDEKINNDQLDDQTNTYKMINEKLDDKINMNTMTHGKMDMFIAYINSQILCEQSDDII